MISFNILRVPNEVFLTRLSSSSSHIIGHLFFLLLLYCHNCGLRLQANFPAKKTFLCLCRRATTSAGHACVPITQSRHTPLQWPTAECVRCEIVSSISLGIGRRRRRATGWERCNEGDLFVFETHTQTTERHQLPSTTETTIVVALVSTGLGSFLPFSWSWLAIIRISTTVRIRASCVFVQFK